VLFTKNGMLPFFTTDEFPNSPIDTQTADVRQIDAEGVLVLRTEVRTTNLGSGLKSALRTWEAD